MVSDLMQKMDDIFMPRFGGAYPAWLILLTTIFVMAYLLIRYLI